MTEIQSFVHDALAAGKTREEIRQALLAASWHADEVASALDEFAEVGFPIPVPRRKPRLSALDAFQHLLAFLTLYLCAFGAGTLFFQFVNLLLPDPLRQSEWYGTEIYGLIRSSASALIIAFPVYLWVSGVLRRAYAEDPERRSSPVRKWLTYLTLFITAGVVIGYLIAIVNQLLGGELSASLAIKVLIVLGIAGAIFGYYLPGLRQDERRISHVAGGAHV